MKTESVTSWACHPPVISSQEGFHGGKSGAVDKTLEWLLTQQCTSCMTILVAPGSFAADNMGHISASELRACVGEFPGDNADANLFDS